MKKICVILLMLITFSTFYGCAEDPEIVRQRYIENKKKFEAKLNQNIADKAKERAQNIIQTFKSSLNLTDTDFVNIAYVLNGYDIMHNVSSLTQFAKQFVYGKDLSPYVVVSKSDMRYWAVLQKINNGALVFLPNEPKEVTFLLEGNIEEIDNQPLRRNYLLKLDGTFTYNTAFGGSKTVYKLKILTDLTGY